MRPGEVFGRMRNEFELIDGKRARIETWNFKQLDDYVSQDLPTHGYEPRKRFNGFDLLGPHNTREMVRGTRYSEEKDLSPLEVQSDRTLLDEDYHRTLAVLEDDKLIGVLINEWVKAIPVMPFWHYTIKFIDVYKDYRNLGVGTELVRTLDGSDFLKGKIFFAGPFTEDGHRYIKHVIKSELKARDYAIIDKFDFNDAIVPRSPGIYHANGNRLDLEEIKELKPWYSQIKDKLEKG